MTIQNQEQALNTNVQDFVHFMTSNTSDIPDVLVGKMAIEKFGHLKKGEVEAGLAAAERIIAERAARLEADKAALGDNGVLLEMCKPTLAAAPQWLNWFAETLQAGIESEVRVHQVDVGDIGEDAMVDVMMPLSDWRMAISNLRKLKFAVDVSNAAGASVPA